MIDTGFPIPDTLPPPARLSRLAALLDLAGRLVLAWEPGGRDHAHALCSLLAQEAADLAQQ